LLLTLTTTHRPATELGFLLHKHPDRLQTFPLPFGRAHVFYPEASENRCTAALLLDIDPVGLVRRGRDSSSFALAEYVNDRPYVASSFMSVALVTVFKSAMTGACKGHEELAAATIPLEAWLPAVPSGGGADMVRSIFEPLGYAVDVDELPVDPEFPEWGAGRHVSLRLAAEVRLVDLLNHLYVLLPVLDGAKHYWVDETEIEKLMRRGEGWLAVHPEREMIVRRYLKHQRQLYSPLLAQLAEAAPTVTEPDEATTEDRLEERGSLREQRLSAVRSALKESGARRVLDLGCGAGALLERLLRDDYELIVGADVSVRALEQATRRLRLDEMHDAQRKRIQLLQTALTYRDGRLRGFDAAVLMEVIEHLDPPRLVALEQNVFASAQPSTVVVTTPNAEYNPTWASLPAGEFRHPDHRFEWTRGEFSAWASGVAERHGYAVRYVAIGPEDAAFGAPTQMAVFSR
jgi:3' terminal RNA ribose 2'-O-methyltransferase Hen1